MKTKEKKSDCAEGREGRRCFITGLGGKIGSKDQSPGMGDMAPGHSATQIGEHGIQRIQ